MKIMKYASVPLALGLTLSAATLSASTAASAAPRAGSVTLTNADNGNGVSVHTGDVVTVKLTGLQGQGITWAWSKPTNSASADLLPLTSSTSANGDATATFVAMTSGTDYISATERCVPTPGYLCSHLVKLWKATVAVW